MSHELILNNAKELHAYLQKSRSAIELALPSHLSADRMMRIGLTCFSTTPKLRQCTAQSILASIVVASQVGLEPGINGQGYLIPYKQTCTFVPGWQGLVGLLNNSGRATAWTNAVYEGDTFECDLGSGAAPIHKPGPNYKDADKIIAVYAVGKVNGASAHVVEWWPMTAVWKHRDRFNKVGRDHYSYQHPEMYARKVVLLQVLKYMPRSIELNNAITAANAFDSGKTTRVEDGLVIEADVEHVESKPSVSVGKKPKPDPVAAFWQEMEDADFYQADVTGALIKIGALKAGQELTPEIVAKIDRQALEEALLN